MPRAVELLRVPSQPGSVDEVLAALDALDPPAVPEQALPYLEVRVLLDAPEPGLRSRIEAALEGKSVRLAKIETSSARNVTPSAALISLDELDRLQPDDIFKRLYQQRYNSEAPAEQIAAFTELLLLPAESDVQ